MKFSVVVISFFVMVLCLTHAFFIHTNQICPTPIPEKFNHVKPGKVVAAYFASWGTYQVADIEPVASVLTHIIYAFAVPNIENGACELYANPSKREITNSGEFIKQHLDQLIALKKKHPHLKILLSVGGATASRNLPVIVSKELLKTFIHSVIQALDKYQYLDDSAHQVVMNYSGLFDGIDLDWEFGSGKKAKEHADSYHEMMQYCFKLLQDRSKKLGKKFLLTCAVEVNKEIIKSLSLPSMLKYVDWFHVMTYDFANSSSAGVGLNAPICNPWSDYSVDNVINFLMNLDISPAKLILGIPLYGHAFDQAQEKIGSVFQKTEKTKALTYSQVKDLYLQNSECNQKWHSKCHVPYVYCPDSKVFVSYDDERSVDFKVSYAKDKHLKGVVFWRLFGDGKDHDLVKSVKM